MQKRLLPLVTMLFVSQACKTVDSVRSDSGLSGAASGESLLQYNIGFENRPSYIPRDVIVLTFDDGVDSINTPKVLDVLKQKGIKASFFINSTGEGDLNNPQAKLVLKRIVDEGHELANHTVSHKHLPEISLAEVKKELAGVRDQVKSIVGRELNMVRVPFGEPFQEESFSPGSQASYPGISKMIAEFGVHIGWNFDSDDWRFQSGEEVFQNVKRLLDEGHHGIILFHSTKPQTADAIARIIDYMRKPENPRLKKHFWLVDDVLKARYGKSSAELTGRAVTNPPVIVKPSEPSKPNEPNKPVIKGCQAQSWKAGHNYRSGDVVEYQGSYFKAVHENPGFDPKISTWFWALETSCSTPATSVPSANCSSPAWQAGRAYQVGEKVLYEKQVFLVKNANPGYDPKISTWFWEAGELCP